MMEKESTFPSKTWETQQIVERQTSKSIEMNSKLQPEPTIAGFNADGIISR